MSELNPLTGDVLTWLVAELVRALDEPRSRDHINELTGSLNNVVNLCQGADGLALQLEIGKTIDSFLSQPSEVAEGEAELLVLAVRGLRLWVELHEDDPEDYLEKDIILDVARSRVYDAWEAFDKIVRGKWDCDVTR